MDGQEALLDVNATAKLLHCSPWTVRKWEAEGRLRATRLGKLVRFEIDIIREFIEAGRKPARDPSGR